METKFDINLQERSLTREQFNPVVERFEESRQAAFQYYDTLHIAALFGHQAQLKDRIIELQREIYAIKNTSPEEPGNFPLYAIILIIVGSIILVVLIGILAYCVQKNKSKGQEKLQSVGNVYEEHFYD